MLIVPPPKFRRSRRLLDETVVAAVPLVLVSATFVATAPYTLNLTFDRAVDTSGLVPSLIVVIDPVTLDSQLNGSTHFAQPSANLIQMRMSLGAAASGSAVVLNVGTGNGIAAADDCTAWAGVAGLVLPFGS